MTMTGARLEVSDPASRTRVVPIQFDRVTIGRSHGNSLSLGSAEISRFHAEIMNRGDSDILRDLGSPAGTFVNDETVIERALGHGELCATEARPVCRARGRDRRRASHRRALPGQPGEGIAQFPGDPTRSRVTAAEAAVAIENARLYRESQAKAHFERELRTAYEFQPALLPTAPPAWDYVSTAADMVPCLSIGGDFFEYLDLDGRFGVVVGDVAGTGASAARLGGRVPGIFVDRPPGADPATTIAAINAAIG